MENWENWKYILIARLSFLVVLVPVNSPIHILFDLLIFLRAFEFFVNKTFKVLKQSAFFFIVKRTPWISKCNLNPLLRFWAVMGTIFIWKTIAFVFFVQLLLQLLNTNDWNFKRLLLFVIFLKHLIDFVSLLRVDQFSNLVLIDWLFVVYWKFVKLSNKWFLNSFRLTFVILRKLWCRFARISTRICFDFAHCWICLVDKWTIKLLFFS